MRFLRLFVLTTLFSCTAMTWGQNARHTTTATGRVLDCSPLGARPGKVTPVRGIRVYAFAPNRGRNVHNIISKIESAWQKRSTTVQGQPVEPVESLYTELYEATARLKTVPRTRTSRDGSFRLSGLQIGSDYLFLAIMPVEDDTSYFQFRRVILVDGKNDASMFIGTESPLACRTDAAKQ